MTGTMTETMPSQVDTDSETETTIVTLKIYKEVPLTDWDEVETGTYIYECPCGDIFSITQQQIEEGLRVVECPSCSLKIRIIV